MKILYMVFTSQAFAYKKTYKSSNCDSKMYYSFRRSIYFTSITDSMGSWCFLRKYIFPTALIILKRLKL